MLHSFTRSLAIKLLPNVEPCREGAVQNNDEVFFVRTCRIMADGGNVGGSPPAEIVLNLQVGKGENGELLEALSRDPFKVIFVRDDETALPADVVSRRTTARSSQKQRSSHHAARRIKKVSDKVHPRDNIATDPGKRIALRMPHYLQMVVYDEIMYCNSDGGYTTFFLTGNRKILMSIPLGKYENSLPASHFIRVHQSYIVNHHFVDRLYKENYLVLTDGTQIPVSVRKKAGLIKALLG